MKIFKIMFLIAVLLVGVPAFAQQSATQQFTLTVTAPTLSITTNTLSGGITGSPYSATLAVTGGQAPYTFSLSVGTLPSGLSLGASSGVISGTPTVAGTSNITVQVADSQIPSVKATKTFAIVIANPLSISTAAIAPASIGTVYSAAISITGGTAPYTCSLSLGSLPTGLTLSTLGSTCVISGTPTQAGAFTFTIKVNDSAPVTASIQVNGSSLIARIFTGELFSRN